MKKNKKIQTQVNSLNDKLKFAASKLPGGSAKISGWVNDLLRHLSGLALPEANDNTPYYTIDSDYNGDLTKLFQHVHFKNLKDDGRTEQIINIIEADPHMTQAQYDKMYAEWQGKSYKGLKATLTEGMTRKGHKLEFDYQMDLSNFEELEQIMNSSPAWQIAKKGSLDSDQALERWTELYRALDLAKNNDDGIFRWAYQQIINQKHSINWLLNAIDDEIKLMLQGKYSHRRHMRY